MRIKIPFVELSNDDCPCHNFEEYEIKIKCVKTKLHARYLACIAIGICVWQFAGVTNSDEFIKQFSFASTITSIILSVLAIIFSIAGEGKTEHIKEQLQESAKGINKTQRKINDINDQIKDNLNLLNEEVKNLHEEIERLPEAVAKKVGEEFIKNTSTETDINISKAPDTMDKNSWMGE